MYPVVLNVGEWGMLMLVERVDVSSMVGTHQTRSVVVLTCLPVSSIVLGLLTACQSNLERVLLNVFCSFCMAPFHDLWALILYSFLPG